jgi:crotonobetainyl-CoA:carnitine CoA-transferase CaiB-like acyl-CoA transferase
MEPLSQVTVIECGEGIAAAFAGRLLADLGAHVIKVESAQGDITRLCGPFRGDLPDLENSGLFLYLNAGVNRAGVFNQWNQGKRSIQLDARHPEGLEIARGLIRHCDVVTENFAVGAMERMGLSYENLSAIREDIILLSISGNGQTGPYARDISYGTTVGALSGIYGLCGYEGFEPMEPRWICAESVAALTGAFAVVAALVHRARTGQGQHIDLSMLETTEMVLAEGLP